MTEADLQGAIMDLARLYGWRAAHFRPSLTQSGRWATAMSGDRGYPDLTLARAGHVLHAELKRDGGRYGPGQAEWAAAIGSTHRLWLPADLRNGAIQKELR